MASKFQATVVSNEYINAVADSAATGKPIAYSGVVASSTVFTDEQLKTLDYAGAQSANKEVTSVVTSSYLKQGSNTIVIEVNLSNENLSTDFQWASVLIYATYNGNNILVAVLRLVTPELFPAYDGKSIVSVGVDLFISVDKTAAANISVNGAGYATIDTVNKLRNYVDNDFNTTIIRSDKDGVLNGSYSFSKAINALGGINGHLNSNTAQFKDFNTVASDMFSYSGFWQIIGSSNILNGPYGTVNKSAFVLVQTAGWVDAGSIIYFELQTKALYVGYVNSAKILWQRISDDSAVIHNIGNETADGIKTFIKQIIAKAGVKGNLQGNADTATKLATARRIGGQPFDGTSDISLPGVNATGNQDTTGNAETASTAAGSDKLNTGRNISVTGDVTAPAQKFDGTKDVALAASLPTITRSDTSSSSSVGYGGTITVIDSVITDSKGRITGLNVSKIAIPASQTTVTGNAGTATKLQTARKIAGVSFDGTQDIDLAGVNKIGNQDTTGNAATATTTLTQDIYGDQDLNDYVNNGIFSISGASVTNSPVNTKNWLTLVVFRNLEKTKAAVSQLLFGQLSNNVYTRNLLGTTWTNWVKLADDSTLVHNTGSENVSGAKNFFDVLTALSGIKGDVTGSLKGNADTSTKLQTPRKINGVGFDGTSDITIDPWTHVISTATNLFTLGNGFYYNAGVASTNKPAAATSYFVIDVIQTSTNGFMRLIDSNGLSFWINKSAGSWGTWHQNAEDGTVVHNSGSQSIAGSITIPIDNSMINIGNDADLAMVKKQGQGATIVIGSGKIFRIQRSNNSKISPTDTMADLLTIDNSGLVYSLNGFKGNLQGNADTATKLATARTINGTKFDGTQDIYVNAANDSNLVHLNGSETVSGDKNFTGNTGLNTVTTTKQQDTTITVAGINIHFIETSLGVNVLASGSYNAAADGQWKNIGTMPSNITLPLMPVVMNSAAAGGISGVSLREGFSVFLRITETGSIDVRYTHFRSNDNKQYTSSVTVDASTNWIK